MKTLLLTEQTIKSLLSMNEVMDAVESAFKEKALGCVQMPAKPYLYYSEYGGDLRVMPSYIESLDTSAVKIVNSHPDNPAKYKLPTVMAIITLINPENGTPLAIMGGVHITAMRTGAAGGIATKYLARKDSRVLGMIGLGVQARTLLTAITRVREIKRVYAFDISWEKSLKFAEKMGKDLGIDVIPVNKPEKAVKPVDILTTATPSRKPIVKNEWVKEGLHINAIGADAAGKEELDPDILKRAKIVVDDWEQASHSGEINVPLTEEIITRESIWGEIEEIVTCLKLGRASPDEITVFDSTGLAIQDAVTAKLAYDKALAKNIGQMIEIL